MDGGRVRIGTHTAVDAAGNQEPERPWWRRWWVITGAAVIAIGVVGTVSGGDKSDDHVDSDAQASSDDNVTTIFVETSAPPTTVVATTAAPTTAAPVTAPPTTVRVVAAAPPVTAAAPPPPTQPAPPPPTAPPATDPPPPEPSGCHPSYSGCVPIASDVDCAGGSGNGPAYVSGPIQINGDDPYGLDSDNDGLGCKSSQKIDLNRHAATPRVTINTMPPVPINVPMPSTTMSSRMIDNAIATPPTRARCRGRRTVAR